MRQTNMMVTRRHLTSLNVAFNRRDAVDVNVSLDVNSFWTIIYIILFFKVLNQFCLFLAVSKLLSFYIDCNSNEGMSAASFCCQVAALVPDMFCNFYLVKIHKIANNLATTEDREKNKHIFGILRISRIYLMHV